MILLTGGLGYIGSHTAVELLDQGNEILIIDDLSNSELSILNRIEEITGKKPFFEQIDLKDFEETKSLFHRYPSINGVIHFAASKSVSESVEHPVKYYRNNIVPILNLLEARNKAKPFSFVFSSSCTVYGQAETIPISENEPTKKPESPYGNTKKIGEDILFDEALASEYLKVLSLRYFNPIGAHSSALIGELPKGTPQNLVPYITQTAIGKRKKLTVLGNDYPTPDGTCIRDYIHVVDLAKAHIKAFHYIQSMKNKMDIFNLGTGKGNSVLEIIHTFEKTNQLSLTYEFGARRKGDVISSYADNSKAVKLLNWKPELTIEDSLRSAWLWEKNRMRE